MTTRTTTQVELRRCTGSARSGIEPHEAPVEDFPKQPSQKDGLGRMCTEHWKAYVKGLRKDALARKAAAPGDDASTAPKASRRTKPATMAKPPANADEAATAEALIAEVDALPGPEAVKRVGEADVQAALETAAQASVGAERMEA